jgi:hypothetical protein
MCIHESLEYIPLSGGLPRKIWDKPDRKLYGLWDWSPDGAIASAAHFSHARRFGAAARCKDGDDA